MKKIIITLYFCMAFIAQSYCQMTVTKTFDSDTDALEFLQAAMGENTIVKTDEDISKANAITKIMGWIITRKLQYISSDDLRKMINHCHCNKSTVVTTIKIVNGVRVNVPRFIIPENCKSLNLF